MHPGARVAGQQSVTGHDRLLGSARPPGQPESGGGRPLVRDGADGQPRFLGVLGDQHTEPGGVFQCAAHDQRVVDAFAVVGEHPHLGGSGGHHAHLGELLAGQSDGDRADRVHVDQADLLPAVPDVVGDHRAVGDRCGVGHREHRGEPAECGCGRTGFDVLSVFAAGLAQMGVQVDEPGQQHLPGGIDHIGIVGDREPGADVGDLPVFDQDVDRVTLAVEPHPTQQHAHAITPLPARPVPARPVAADSVPTSR